MARIGRQKMEKGPPMKFVLSTAAALAMLLPAAALAQTAPTTPDAAGAPASAPTPGAATIATAPAAKFNLDTPIETLVADPKAKAVLDADFGADITTNPQYDGFKAMSLKPGQAVCAGQAARRAVEEDRDRSRRDPVSRVRPGMPSPAAVRVSRRGWLRTGTRRAARPGRSIRRSPRWWHCPAPDRRGPWPRAATRPA